MTKRRRLDKPKRRKENIQSVPAKDISTVPPTNQSFVISEEEPLSKPELLRAFWDRYFNSLEETRQEIEQRQKKSIRWARETLIR
jgi:hypothetical protein